MEMMPDQQDNTFSTQIEELDGDNGLGRAERSYRTESLLGGLLLAALLVVVGWYWMEQRSKQAEYRAGVRAEAAEEWQSALADYGAASGYADADQRAGEA